MKWALVVSMVALALPGVSLDVPQSAGSKPARVSKLFHHHSTVAWSCPSSGVKAFVYKAGMAVDADGAYRAYHPHDRLGLDSIDHAGYAGNWWALATDTGDPNGRPVVQRKGDPAPGYYVSMTSLYDARIRSERNPRRFVDAARIPYVVLPPIAFKHAKLGDFATVINLRTGRVAGAIVADESAPDLPMGEGSIALAEALGINSNPRTGGTDDGVAYVIYPGSGTGKPRSAKAIAVISQHAFQSWGGVNQLRACLRLQAPEVRVSSPEQHSALAKPN